MAISSEMLWNKICAIHDEVHDNTKNIGIINERLNNHLAHQDKKTNQKLTLFGIFMGAGVALAAILL